MNRVVIVEDEAYVRSSLERLVDWASINCEIAGAFASAEEALEYTGLGNIDLILSDIRMDGMDGVAFAGKVKEIHPAVRFIFLTGYSDFSYAQAAVKLHADDFILKPTDPGELERIVRRVVGEIDREKKDSEYTAGLREQAGSAREILRGRFLLELFEADRSRSGQSEGCMSKRVFELGLPSGPLIPVVFSVDSENARLQDDQLQKLVRAAADDMCAPCACTLAGPDYCFCVISGKSFEEAAAFASRMIQGNTDPLCARSAGMGLPCDNWEEFPAAASAALDALDHRWYAGTGKVIHASEAFTGSEAEPVESPASIQAFLDLVRSGDGQGALKILETMATHLRIRGSPRADRTFLADLHGLLLAVRDEDPSVSGSRPGRLEEIRTARIALERIPVLEEAVAVLGKAVREITTRAQRVPATQGTLIVSGALEFIALNFHRSIGVEDIAASVSKHPKHLCRVVKEATGITVMDHLLSLRMNKALEYLSDPNLSISEIASRVGIPDAQYFARLFRKTYGITPSEHRSSGSMQLFSTKTSLPSIHGGNNP